jgi:hypothetical protein
MGKAVAIERSVEVQSDLKRNLVSIWCLFLLNTFENKESLAAYSSFHMDE